MDLTFSGQFEDYNDDLVFFDSDLLKHEIEQQNQPQPPQQQQTVLQQQQVQQQPLSVQQKPAEELSQFQRYNQGLADHCDKVGQSLIYDLSRLGWAQKKGMCPEHVAALAAFRQRLNGAQRDTMRVLSGTLLLPSALAAILALRELLGVIAVQLDILDAEVFFLFFLFRFSSSFL
jgi:hypothetical protein